jgi:ATP-dependent Clp protease adaptor protein ClpS
LRGETFPFGTTRIWPWAPVQFTASLGFPHTDRGRVADETVFAHSGSVKVLETETMPNPVIEQGTESEDSLAPTFYVICWNDPVNLMVYVTHVFMKIFGWTKEKAQKHMLEVHEQGKSVLTREGAEKAEFYVHRLQEYKLHATMEPAE